ncbi:MAG: hypothetical protein ACRC62_14240 [Microcoleus sp.]
MTNPTQTHLNRLLFLTITTCSFILILSIYPGLLQTLPVMLAIALIGLFFLLAIGFGLILFAIDIIQKLQSPQNRAIDLKSNFSKNSLIRICLILVIFISSYGLLKFYIPRRIAFTFARPAFEGWLRKKPPQNTNQNSPNIPRQLNIKLGIYQVDSYAIDRRGGQYFRVHSHGDGLGPDTISYGFVYQPNREGSPFGDAYYRIYSLGDGWFWFQASNDW